MKTGPSSIVEVLASLPDHEFSTEKHTLGPLNRGATHGEEDAMPSSRRGQATHGGRGRAAFLA